VYLSERSHQIGPVRVKVVPTPVRECPGRAIASGSGRKQSAVAPAIAGSSGRYDAPSYPHRSGCYRSPAGGRITERQDGEKSQPRHGAESDGLGCAMRWPQPGPPNVGEIP